MTTDRQNGSDDRIPDDATGGDSADVPQSSDVTAGKGRKDEVGRSGIYPASGADVPADAEVISPGEFGHRKG